MAKTVAKPKSAKDTLIDTMTRLRSDAKQRMSEKEFRHVEDKFHQLANKVRASRGGKRETA